MKKILLASLLVASPALAQQQTSTAPDRVAVSLGRCVLQAEQQTDQVADLQKQLAAAQARIKELEPKPDTPAK